MCPATVWSISGLRSRRINDTAPAPQLSFFMAQAPALTCIRFQKLKFQLPCLGVPQVEWKMN